MAVNKALGLAIKARREYLDIPQKALAKALKINSQNISRYETGRQAISIRRLEQIAEALGSGATILMTIADGVARNVARSKATRSAIKPPLTKEHFGGKPLDLSGAAAKKRGNRTG